MKRFVTVLVILILALPAFAADAPKKSYFIYFLKLVRKDAIKTGFNPSEQAIMGEHTEFHSKLTKEGTEVIAGPTLDEDPVGICVFSAASMAEAEAIAHSDPAVRKGMMTVTVHPFGFAFGTAKP